MSHACGIVAPSYALGEQEIAVDALANRAQLMQQYNMPDRRELWGWGYFRKTERSRVELASASAAATLARGGIAPAAIDALLLCCGHGLNYFEQNRFTTELARTLDIDCRFVSWVGGAGCASLFSAVGIAQALVRGEMADNVLVVSVDKVDDDSARFQRYGVFSDAACSFVVRARGALDYVLRGSAIASSLRSLDNAGLDMAQKCELIRSVFERLGDTGDFPFAGSALFGSNVFLPIQQLESSVMPIDGLRAYRDNTARYGHCAAADPFINLVDFYADASRSAPLGAVLASSAHGHYGVILLQPGAPQPSAALT